MARVGFVGLGVMGAPMAGHLHQAGNDTIVWNRTVAKSEPLRAQGIAVADSLAALAVHSDMVFLCVNRSEDVADCVAEMKNTARPGTLFVDHSTIAPEAAIALHIDLKESGFRFIDAPITGGSMGAQRGQLTIFCGGDESTIAEAMPVLSAYAKRAERVGGPGAGQMMKMANQIAVGGALMALCESLAFADRAGLDLAQTRELLSGGAAGSWAFDNYGPKILTRDWTPGFSIKNQRKDFGYCLEAADSLELDLPATALIDELLGELESEGRGEETTAALFELLVRRA